MKDEELLKLLKSSLRSEDALPVSDEEVREFLSEPPDCPPEALERMRAKLTKKVLSDLHPDPVRIVAQGWSFAQWIKDARRRANLTLKDIAAALRRDDRYVRRLEDEEIFPWNLGLEEAADLIVLFRVAMKAATQLLLRSLDVSKARSSRTDFGSGTLTTGMIDLGDRSGFRTEGGKRFDLPEMTVWLDQLEAELRRRGASDLL
jgi:transcriptional regulator with XRE-family HTH domain